ncbi:hypothetical protein BGW80DRAFT_1465734 [Lactifluus volemus]|nr:hypothetical protein BGW80DRAFT_1465734 [Lactifluus volemus]
MSTITLFEWRCISDFASTPFVLQPSVQARASRDTQSWLYFTRGNGHGPLLCPSSQALKSSSKRIHNNLRSLPLTRAILPALTEFRFRGVSEYLEDLLARIDVPQLEYLSVWFFQQEVFNTRQVISHSRALGPFHCATVTFGQFSTHINLQRAPGQQVSVSSIAQICTQLSPLLSSVTKLYIESIEASEGDDVGDLMDNPDLLLLLFHQFAAVWTLHLSGQILPILVSFLGRLTGESVIGVLPELQNLYLRDNVLRCFEEPQALEKFIAACRDSDHPVTYGVGPY